MFVIGVTMVSKKKRISWCVRLQSSAAVANLGSPIIPVFGGGKLIII